MMRRVIAMMVLTVLLASCSGAGDDGSTTASPTTTPAAAGEIDATFDVGGHKLHLNCQGSGSPTVVYLHGLSHAPGDASGASAGQLPSLVAAKHRFCGYDRANTGSSDKVTGPLTGKTSVADLHRLLQAAQIRPPYVLLGASFGGLVAYIYAVTYPKEVTGMLLLDAAFPDEFALERLFPEDERLTHDEWQDMEEQIDELGAYQEAYALIGKEPAIPVTYLRATQSDLWTGPPAYEAAVPKSIARYIDRFTPGVVRDVESPHYMEAAVPDRIVQELDKVIVSP
jgi:pimeloyl-ACP methyl ester carboxylesterase